MIAVFTGDNEYEIQQKMTEVASGAVRLDGAELTPEQFSERVLGVDMFSASAPVRIDALSECRAIADDCETWLGRVDDATQLVIYEPSLDKRTKYYKWLKKHATMYDLTRPSVRQAGQVAQWLVTQCRERSIVLDASLADNMVRRCVVMNAAQKECIDVLRLMRATQLLDGTVTQRDIDAVLPVSLAQNSFDLLNKALAGDTDYVVERIRDLRRSEQPYMVLGLLVSQVNNMVALWAADDVMTTAEVAKQIGAHPFVLQQMERYKALPRIKVSGCVSALADADMAIKTGRAEPWDSVSFALLTIATKYSA